jgi:hypothetical protein
LLASLSSLGFLNGNEMDGERAEPTLPCIDLRRCSPSPPSIAGQSCPEPALAATLPLPASLQRAAVE